MSGIGRTLLGHFLDISLMFLHLLSAIKIQMKNSIRLLVFCLVSACMGTLLAQERLVLLEIPMSDPKFKVVYSIKTERCEFAKESKVNVAMVETLKKNKQDKEKLDFIEKIYFDIDEEKLESTELSFKLKTASNLTLKFKFVECQLHQRVLIDDHVFKYDSIEVKYNTTLGAPVLKKLLLTSSDGTQTIYPHSLKGHLPLYELSVGGALSIRNNLRPQNEKTFLKDDPILEPIAVFLFRYATFFANRDGLGHALFAYDGLVLLGAAMYDGEPYERAGLRERRKGIFLGPLLRWKFLEVKYMRDWIRQKRGEELKIMLSHEFRPSLNTQIIPNIYAQFWNDDYAHYYTGVDAGEAARTGFAPYQGQSAVNYSLMCRIIHNQQQLAYVADFGIKLLDPVIYKSPIITDKYELRLALGLLYRVF